MALERRSSPYNTIILHYPHISAALVFQLREKAGLNEDDLDLYSSFAIGLWPDDHAS